MDGNKVFVLFLYIYIGINFQRWQRKIVLNVIQNNVNYFMAVSEQTSKDIRIHLEVYWSGEFVKKIR